VKHWNSNEHKAWIGDLNENKLKGYMGNVLSIYERNKPATFPRSVFFGAGN
jgi:hypothetical protein